MFDQIQALLADNEIFTWPTLLQYWDGTVMTIQLVFISLVLGFFLALPLAVARGARNPILAKGSWLFSYVFRGTPLLIQLYLIYYGLPAIPGIKESFLWDYLAEPLYPCLLAFTLSTAAYSMEIFWGAIKATPKGEIEAAQAYGMSRPTILRRIIIPSALRRALPAYGNEIIFMLHASSIASVVTLMDITGAARDVYALHYAPFEAFTAAAAIYLTITFGLIALFKRLEKRFHRHLQPLS